MTAGAAALLDAAAARLRAAGVEQARREARLLLALATGRAPADLLAGYAPSDAEAARLEALAARRSCREPMAYIRGSIGFWDLELTVQPGVLIPRPETETLIEAALQVRTDPAAPLRILDLGIGTGCILLTLLRQFPASTGVGVDRSSTALACCAQNAERLGLVGRLDLLHGDWADSPAGPFDLLVSNPPYVSDVEHAVLEPEVRDHEPALALLGGVDGLHAYRALVPEAAARLTPDGHLVLEIGAGQCSPVRSIIESHDLTVERCLSDLAGIERCMVARRR